MGNTSEKGFRDVEKILGRNFPVEIFDGKLIPDSANIDFSEWKNKFSDGRIPDHEMPNTLIFKVNKEWAEKIKNEGYTIIDIGSSHNKTPSIFYEMEIETIFKQLEIQVDLKSEKIKKLISEKNFITLNSFLKKIENIIKKFNYTLDQEITLEKDLLSYEYFTFTFSSPIIHRKIQIAYYSRMECLRVIIVGETNSQYFVLRDFLCQSNMDTQILNRKENDSFEKYADQLFIFLEKLINNELSKIISGFSFARLLF
jgi:hypothetical protein